MVYLTPRFSILASILALSVLSLPVPADGIALPRTHNGNVALPRYVVHEPRHSDKKNDAKYDDDNDDDKKTKSKGSSSKGGSKPQRSSSPQLGLPSRATKKGKGGKAKGGKHGSTAKHGSGAKHGGDKHGKGRHEQRMIYDPSDPLIRIGPLDVVGHDHSEGNHAHVNLLDIRKREEGVQGTVDITSASAESPNGHRIASMWLDTTSSNGTFTLTASDVNQTQLYMVSIADGQYNKTSSESDPDDKRVKLQLPVFNSTAAAMTLYCVFFNPSPPQPEPMTMEPCLIDGAAPPANKSEMFAYNARTGVIRPMWFQGKDDGKKDGFSTASYDDEYYEPGYGYADADPATPESADIASVNSVNSTAPSNSTSTNTTSSTDAWNSWSANNNSVVARGNTPFQVQNVTLVFTPTAPQVVKVAGFSSSSVSATKSAAPVSTSVVTATTTMTTSETATTTMTLVQISASASGSGSATSAEATTSSAAQISVQNLAVSSSATESVPSSTASASTTQSSSTESVVVSAMEASPSTVTAYSTVYATESAPPSSSASASASYINADAVASSIAAGSSSSAAPSPTEVTVDAINAFAAGSPASTSSAASSTMTPVTTAPYTWMFTPDSRL